MTTQKNNNHKSHTVAVCSSPTLGRKLPDYIVDLLNDEEAFELEKHLVECHVCKERYLTVLRAQSEGLRKREEIAPADNGASQIPKEGFGDVNMTNH